MRWKSFFQMQTVYSLMHHLPQNAMNWLMLNFLPPLTSLRAWLHVCCLATITTVWCLAKLQMYQKLFNSQASLVTDIWYKECIKKSTKAYGASYQLSHCQVGRHRYAMWSWWHPIHMPGHSITYMNIGPVIEYKQIIVGSVTVLATYWGVHFSYSTLNSSEVVIVMQCMWKTPPPSKHPYNYIVWCDWPSPQLSARVCTQLTMQFRQAIDCMGK